MLIEGAAPWVAAPMGALSSLVTVAQNLGNDFFRADIAWRTRTSRQKLLLFFQACFQESLDNIQQEASFLGHDQHVAQSFKEAMKEAKKLVDGVVAKRADRNPTFCHTRCMYIFCGTICPQSLDRPDRAAIKAYDDIFKELLLRAQIIEAGRTSVERQLLQLRVSHDERYVPLHDSEQKMFSALEEAGTDRVVVVLSGGPGKGKSTLVRHIGLQYRDKIRSSRFTKVVMLECGLNVDVPSKQTELLQMLGGLSHISQQSQGADFNVEKGLQIRLSDPNLLIILDDIWEGPLMSEFVNLSSGSELGAKWLLASQQESIGQCLKPICKCKTYKIEDLSHENAEKILASSADFENKKIPEHLQEVADDIIKKTESNPLALATLGAQIAKAGKGELEVWNEVQRDLSGCLDRGLPGNIHGVDYPRSFMATMQRSIDDLPCDQKQLLALISMCSALSVSKHALQFLSSVVISKGKYNLDLVMFRIYCSDLASRHLLAKNEIGSTVVSIHSLTKRYVLYRMEDTVKRVDEELLKLRNPDSKTEVLNPSRASVTRVLADFFIDANCRSCSSAPLATDSDSSPDFPKSHQTQQKGANLEHKRTTSEPIIELLLKTPSRNEWTKKLGICAQKVLLEFVDKNRLDQESISQLLGSPSAVRSILTFLEHVCLLEKSFWVEGNYVGCNSSVPGAFLKLLQDDSCAALQERAASVLADLCWSHKENSNAFARTTGMLPRLGLFLSQGFNFNLQKYAARVLAACAYWDYYCDGSVVPKIVAEAGVVDSLVDILDKEQNESVQIAVAHALSNLATAKAVVEGDVSAHGDPNLRQDRTSVISGNPRDDLAQRQDGRLLEVLIKSLEIPDSPVLQAHACSTLANIAGTEKIKTLETLIKFPGLVDKLVSILTEDRSPQLQQQAARALCNLATYREGSLIRQKLIRWPELVTALANSLLRSESPSLQLNAVSAFRHLAYQVEEDPANGLINHRGLVESLMQLSERQNSCAQAASRAVSALCSLTDVGDDSLRARITSSPPFLATLTESILAGESSGESCHNFEADVVCLIANLAVTSEPEILDSIVNSPGLVDKLAKSLEENQSSSLKKGAIRALLNLAGEENNNDPDFSCDSEFAGLLQRLQQALLRSGRPALTETRLSLKVTALISRANAKGKESAERGAATFLDKFIKQLSKG